MASPLSPDSAARRRLEEFDALRVTRKLREYFAPGEPDQVRIILPTSSTAFGAFAEVEILIPSLTLTGGIDCVLAEIGMGWPPSDPLAVDRQPINILGLHVERGGHTVDSVSLYAADASTRIMARTSSLTNLAGTTRITFSSPSLLFLLADAYPFHKYALSLDLALPTGCGRTVMYLDHGLDIGLRCRIDNSDYHSLAYTSQPGHVRKITFFARPTIRIRYQYGINGTAAITDIIRPLYGSGIGAMSAALTVSLVRVGREDLASAALALALVPPFAQLIRVTSPLYRSADIARQGASGRVWLLAAALYTPVIIAMAWLLTREETDKAWTHADLFEAVGYGAGGAAILLSLLYAVLVREQAIPRHYCDNCARWLVSKRRRRLHMNSRKTLCPSCFERDEVMRVETEAENAS